MPRVPKLFSLSLSTSLRATRRFAPNFVKFRVSRCSHAARNRARPSTRANPPPIYEVTTRDRWKFETCSPETCRALVARRKEKLLRAGTNVFSPSAFGQPPMRRRYFFLSLSKARQRLELTRRTVNDSVRNDEECQRGDVNSSEITVRLIAITRQDLSRRYFSEYENVT